jgi:Domain of unknown function (DUF5658)
MSRRSRCVDGPVARRSLVAASLVLLAAAPVRAQGHELVPTAAIADAIVAIESEAPVPPAGRAPLTTIAARSVTPAEPRRPSLLVPLYITFGALQAMDAHSTMQALRGGAREQNPIVEPFGRNGAALFAIKSATTVGTIVLAEKLRQRHPVKAMVMMTAVNVAYAAIVAANYRR